VLEEHSGFYVGRELRIPKAERGAS
jgi:hypothetical protein